MSIPAIASLDEFNTLINGEDYVAIDFWATWCGPCRMISPIFEKLSETSTGVRCYKVDVDDQPDIAQQVGITAMPTFILFRNGEEVEKMVGANPQALQSLFNKAV